MRLSAAILLAVAAYALAPMPATAQPVLADAAEGRVLASKLCSNCHVTEGQSATSPRADVPSFVAIANSPRTTAESLAAAIILPHPEMPGIALTRSEIRNVIGYILSLKK